MGLLGYKHRKHIAKALQARSREIRTTLEHFNTAARALKKDELKWDEVVEYAFLSDFDLLRDARQDIRTRTWATPACHLALDRYFKIQRAQEELDRLNIEIKRVATYIRDEDAGEREFVGGIRSSGRVPYPTISTRTESIRRTAYATIPQVSGDPRLHGKHHRRNARRQR